MFVKVFSVNSRRAMELALLLTTLGAFISLVSTIPQETNRDKDITPREQGSIYDNIAEDPYRSAKNIPQETNRDKDITPRKQESIYDNIAEDPYRSAKNILDDRIKRASGDPEYPTDPEDRSFTTRIKRASGNPEYPTDPDDRSFRSRLARAVQTHIKLSEGFRRSRRTVDTLLDKWPGPDYKVAYVFDSSYADPYFREVVQRAVREFNDRVCITLVDETSRYNASDPNCFSKLGYKTNSYLSFNNGTGCSASTSGGPDPNGGDVKIKPCVRSNSNLHEIMHAFAVMHYQLGRSASKYISVFSDNIEPTSLFNYLSNTKNASSVTYDRASDLHYEDTGFSSNSLRTYSCMREDICQPEEDSTEDVIYQELTDLYKCVEIYCAHVSTDCHSGYLAFYKKKCQCRCPSEYDHNTNCKDVINKADKSLSWASRVSLFAGGEDNSCPEGFDPTGWLSFPGIWAAYQRASPVPMPVEGRTIRMPICSKTQIDREDWWSWPLGGRYCFIKPKDIATCGKPYNDFKISFQGTADVTHNGSIGDVTVSGHNVTIKLCCRTHDSSTLVIDLPNEKAFRMFSTAVCARVRGMREYMYRVDFYTRRQSFSGGPAEPRYFSYPNDTILYFCYYQPPVYGCNVHTVLNFNSRAVTIVTPGFPNARTPNVRCFYTFEVPHDSQLRLTFNKYNLSVDDKFMVKRFTKWNIAYRIDNWNYPAQIISENNYLALEYSAGYQDVPNPGVNFTVEVLFDKESCYNASQNGADYVGDTSTSEYGEPCLYWKDTINCRESPYKTWDAHLQYLTGNKCRNPDGKLYQPWCFVYMNGTNCVKRYCDVCNNYAVADRLNSSTCSKSISDDQTTCASSPQRFPCAKTCNLPRPSSGVTDCKTGWYPYKDRCVYVSTRTAYHDDAKRQCKNLASGATLLQIRDLDDQNYLRLLKSVMRGTYLWINGAYNRNTGAWFFEDTNIQLTYTNWTANAPIQNSYYSCVSVYLPATYSTISGGWLPVNCYTSVRTYYLCQTARTVTCGRPAIPRDAVVSESLKYFYRVGERVYLRCRTDPATFSDQRSLMCTNNGWTTLRSACTECPESWTPYQGLCVYFIKNYLTRSDAEDYCRSFGRNGTLFRVTNEEDHALVKDLRTASGASTSDHTWVSGYMCNASGAICYTDSTTRMTYYNLIGSASSNCVYLYRAYSSSGRGGSLGTIICDSTSNKLTVACQIDKTSVPTDLDRVTTCQAALNEYPHYCKDVEASAVCAKSCGQIPGTVQCALPSSSTYIRTSPNATVYPGVVMTIACKPGYFLTSGDTSRACGLSGNLLGVVPVCSATPSAVTSNYFLLTRMFHVLPAGQAFIMDQDNYRILLNGKVTAWFTYCVNSGTIYFLVYRKTGSSYNLLGYNQFECQPNSIFRYTVPAASQITVLKDDMIGAFSPAAATLSITDCTGADNMLMTIPSPKADFENPMNCDPRP